MAEPVRPPAPAERWARANLGQGGAWLRLSPRGDTWRLQAGGRRLVVKALGRDTDPDESLAVARVAAAAGLGPVVVDSVVGDDGRWVVLGYVDGAQPGPADPDWQRLWALMPRALDRVRQLPPVGLDLAEHWTSVVGNFPFAEPAARRLQDRLDRLRPAHEPSHALAHGDFSPQNMVLVGDSVVLLDWELAGHAPEGFDAGWLLALTHTGIVPAPLGTERLEVALTGDRVPADAVRWYRDLGLLRLLWRAHTLPLGEVHRALMRAQLLLAIEAAAAGYAPSQRARPSRRRPLRS